MMAPRPHLVRPLRSLSLACISAHGVILITRSLSRQTFAREAPKTGRLRPQEGLTTERVKTVAFHVPGRTC